MQPRRRRRLLPRRLVRSSLAEAAARAPVMEMGEGHLKIKVLLRRLRRLPKAGRRPTWGKRGAGSVAATQPAEDLLPTKWTFYRSQVPEAGRDPLASNDTLSGLPRVPDMFHQFDSTELEDGLQRLIDAPYTHTHTHTPA